MCVQVIQVEGIRLHRCRTREGRRDDGIGDGRIDVEGDVEGIVNFGPRDVEAVALDKAMVGQGVEIWTWTTF